jgi:hypothetical protein
MAYHACTVRLPSESREPPPRAVCGVRCALCAGCVLCSLTAAENTAQHTALRLSGVGARGRQSTWGTQEAYRTAALGWSPSLCSAFDSGFFLSTARPASSLNPPCSAPYYECEQRGGGAGPRADALTVTGWRRGEGRGRGTSPRAAAAVCSAVWRRARARAARARGCTPRPVERGADPGSRADALAGWRADGRRPRRCSRRR